MVTFGLYVEKASCKDVKPEIEIEEGMPREWSLLIANFNEESFCERRAMLQIQEGLLRMKVIKPGNMVPSVEVPRPVTYIPVPIMSKRISIVKS